MRLLVVVSVAPHPQPFSGGLLRSVLFPNDVATLSTSLTLPSSSEQAQY